MPGAQDGSLAGATKPSTMADQEKTDIPRTASSSDVDIANEVGEKTQEDDGKPHYPVWQWILTLIGLYTGALLYGNYQHRLSPRSSLTTL